MNTVSESDANLTEKISVLKQNIKELESKLQKRDEQEKKLADQQAFLEGIYFGSGMPTFVVDVTPENTFRFAGLNPAHEAITGMKSDWIKGKSLEDLEEAIPKDIIAEIRARYTRCLNAGTQINYEEKLIIYEKDSWWKTTLTPLKDSKGKTYRIIGSAMNITELKEAQQQIEKSRDKLEEMVVDRTSKLMRSQAILNSFTAHVPGILFVLDKKSRIIFCDGQGLHKLGLHKSEIENCPIENLLANKEILDENIQNVFAGNEVNLKLQYNRMHFEVFLHPVLEETQPVKNIVGLALDVTPWIMSEAKRKQKEQDYKFLFDNMNEGFAFHEIIVDEGNQPVDYRYLDINPAFSEMTGLTRELSIGKTIREVMPGIENDPANWIGRFGEVALKGKEMTIEDYSAPLKKWFRVHAFPGRENQFGVTFSDITEIKNQQDAIQEANNFNTLILESSPLAKLTLNEKGECTSANGRAISLLLAPDKKFQHITKELLVQWGRELLESKMDEVITTGENTTLLLKHFTDDGINRWYEVFLSSFTSKNEKHLLIQIADVSEQKNTAIERDLFFNTSLTLFCTADFNGYFRQLNSAWHELFGWEIEELLSKPFADFLHPDDLDSTAATVRDIKKGYRTTNFINRYRTKSGGYKILKWDALALDDIMYCSATDITELINRENEIKAKKDELEILVRQLEISNEELQQFAYVASHDLQEPLRKIKNFSELLAQHYKNSLDEKAERYISYLVGGAARLQSLINDLLTYSRITSQGREFERINMESVLQNALQNISMSLKESGGIIKHDPLPIIMADASQITQLLQNLIGNAVKYRKENVNPKIQINVHETESGYTFVVNDNGIGFEQEFADRIFVVFQRLHSSTEFEGTGIGLALCKRIVERHGGRIWAESKPGEGSSFYFTLAGIN